ncbi:MAG TPA: TadE family type IV pilus minor pilin [Mycobacteriales bacterium]|nr:TadE family type IV pilus minor pilin [Mycobacteriales bacterium]
MPPPTHPTTRRVHGCRGTATAETAVVLPVLVLLVGVALWALGAITVQLRCVDASRAGARAAARGEPVVEVRARAAAAAGSGAEVDVELGSGTAVVTVTRRVAPPWPVLRRLLPPVVVRAAATTDVEPGGPDR